MIEKGTVDYLNVHASRDEAVLNIFEKSFRPIRGQAAYSLKLPDTNLILFVSGRTYNDGQATVHIANLTTRTIQSFPAHDSHIGGNISSNSTPQQFEQVESLKDDKLVIKAGFLDRRFSYWIDLKKLEFEREEAMYPESLRGTTNIYVFPLGLRSKAENRSAHTFDLAPIQ